MNRYINAFSISILLHFFLAFIIFFNYKSSPIKETQKEKIIKISLSSIQEVKEVKNLKNIDLKPRNKPKQKIKPKLNQKKLVKKIPIVKKTIKKDKPKPLNNIVEQKVINSKPTDLPIKTIAKKKVTKQIDFEAQYMDKNIKKIVELLKENLYYPRSARKRGVEGEVVVKFRLLKDSTIDSITIVSSQSKILSRAAIKTIKNLSGMFPKPKWEVSLYVPIKFSLKR